ncbi:MAG: glycosyltransferase family 2 protein [Bryobacteraceae bacterium]|nr:glycosyltransferase family 2 protein [Bryobacteraceae bacterium]
MATLALIIPACDEAEVIADTLDGLPAGMFAQVIVAVNGSRDATAAIARARGASVVEIAERGYGAACLAAMDLVEADIVLFLQADGSEDASEAPLLVEPLLRGTADLVLGSRTLGEALPGALLPHQRFGNFVATALIRGLYGHTYSDLGPFRALRTSTLRSLGMRDRNFGWTVEMQVRALQQGLRVQEVPVRYGLRQAGTPKVAGRWDASLRAGWVILTTVARLRLGR